MQESVGVVTPRCPTCHSEKGSERSIMYSLGGKEWPCDDAFHMRAIVASDSYSHSVVTLCCKKLHRDRRHPYTEGGCICELYTCPDHGDQHCGTHD